MRIGLSGPIAAHKQNLLDDLSDSIKFRNYKVDDNFWYLDEMDGLHEQVYNLYMNSHQITSCSTFDTIVQSKYMLNNKIITDDDYLEVGKAWLQTMELYNVIFYLPPDDDEEINQKEFDLWGLYDKAIHKYEVPVITLSGTRKERKDQFMRIFL